MNSIIRNLILIGIILSPVHFAQGADKKNTGRRTWIVSTSLPDDVKSPVTILAGGKLSEVRLSKRSVGAAIKVSKDGIIQVVKPMDAADGTASYESLVSVKIPKGIKESLLILVPDASLKPPLKFKVHVVDLDKFRGGHALFVNLTDFEISVVLGEQRTTIQTNKLEVVDIAGPKGTKKTTISYHYRSPKKEAEEEKWKLISASTIATQSKSREILIFSYNKNLEQIGYHGMSFHVSK